LSIQEADWVDVKCTRDAVVTTVVEETWGKMVRLVGKVKKKGGMRDRGYRVFCAGWADVEHTRKAVCKQ
jgi:hypothetical protein